jgi:pyrroline-5-carboxylate reductase
MTREGLNILDADDRLLTLLTDTLAAARDRGEAMARGD